jgi:hypothetical protein
VAKADGVSGRSPQGGGRKPASAPRQTLDACNAFIDSAIPRLLKGGSLTSEEQASLPQRLAQATAAFGESLMQEMAVTDPFKSPRDQLRQTYDLFMAMRTFADMMDADPALLVPEWDRFEQIKLTVFEQHLEAVTKALKAAIEADAPAEIAERSAQITSAVRELRPAMFSLDTDATRVLYAQTRIKLEAATRLIDSSFGP